MKLNLSRKWIAKLLSLLLAIGIWVLIKTNFRKEPEGSQRFFDPPRAVPVDEDTLEPEG